MLFKVLHRYTAKILTDAGDDLRGSEQPGRLDDRPLPMDPMRFNGIQPGTFDRQAPGQEAYTAMALDLLMWARTQVRTSRLRCQEAWSHSSTRTRFRSAASRWQSQARKAVVTWLTGRPSTNRSRTSSTVGSQQPVAGQGFGVRVRPWRAPARPAAGAPRGPAVQSRAGPVRLHQVSSAHAQHPVADGARLGGSAGRAVFFNA